MIQQFTITLLSIYAVLHAELCLCATDSYFLHADLRLCPAESNLLNADLCLCPAE